MKNKSRILLLILYPALVLAQFEGDEAVWDGISAFYNYKSKESVEILQKARTEYPEHPAVHMTWAAAKYLDNQANSSIEDTYDVLEKDLNEVADIYETLHIKYPDIPEYELFLGSAVGFKARVFLGRKEWIKTLFYAYQGFRIVRKLEKDHPELVDNYLPIGIVEYFAGISGSLIQYATNILGFTPTKKSGLTRIQKAADDGPYSWIEASSILCFINLWVENNPSISLKYSGKLISNFPDNYYFRIIHLESMIKTDPEWNTIDYINDMENRLAGLTDIQRAWYVPFLNYEKALVAFHDGNYNVSRSLLESSISSHAAELDMILGEAYFLLGRIHELEGNFNHASEAYEKCYSLQNHTYAVKQAEIRKNALNR